MEKVQRRGQPVTGFGIGWNLPTPSSVLHWVSPDHPSAEVDALIKVSDARVQQLTDAFAAFYQRWNTLDPAAYNDFVNDYTKFMARYAVAKMNTMQWLVSPDAKYAILSKAFRQNYPPDGATETKGDWADLYKRLNAAQRGAGASPLIDRPPPDLANNQSNSLAMKFYRATMPFEAPLRLAEALYDTARTQLNDARHQIGEAMDTIRWIKEHEKALVIGAVSLVAVVGGLYMAPIIKSYLPRTRREPEPE